MHYGQSIYHDYDMIAVSNVQLYNDDFCLSEFKQIIFRGEKTKQKLRPVSCVICVSSCVTAKLLYESHFVLAFLMHPHSPAPPLSTTTNSMSPVSTNSNSHHAPLLRPHLFTSI